MDINKEILKLDWEREPKGLYAPIAYTLAAGGKRVRPQLAMIGSQLFGGKDEEVLPAALALEVFHNFTLLHDDVMDKAEVRRGRPTVHIQWNENTAILSGDQMMIEAYTLLSQVPERALARVLQLFNKMATEICEGQQYDVDFEQKSDVTIEEYLMMIRLKTSVLLANALQIGAYIAGASEEEQQAVYQFGINIGLAFQIQDDILDVWGDPKTFGKAVGGDIACNKKTFVYLEAMRRLGERAPQNASVFGDPAKAMRREGERLLSTERDLIFCQAEAGTYHLRLEIHDEYNPINHSFTIVVFDEEVAYSPYISRVFEYNPAPGQFINTMPEYEEGDTYQTMLGKVEDAIAGTNRSLISLGGWGGYVTFAFDHSVVNTPNKSDFIVEGNAFYASAGNKNGSSEPGIVMVSIDVNQNGLPDDPFYELAGSEYTNPATIHQYALTYHRTPAEHTPQADKKNSLTDTTYILWQNSQGEQGYLHKNTFHTQDYFPLWFTDSTLTFTGTRLPDNAVDKSGKGNMWVQTAFDYGYADSHPNDSISRCSFDIAWAVTAEGEPANLPCADFVRVYTGVHQQCGWIGEISTEISHARDLNIEK